MWWIVAGFALAKSPCAALKPKAELDPAAMGRVSGALQSAMSAAGVPGQVGALAGDAAKGLAALGQDQGARDWTLYQICTLKEAGLLSPAKAEELAAAVVSGSAPPAAVSAGPAPAPTPAPTPVAPAAFPPAPPGLLPQQLAGRLSWEASARSVCVAHPGPACDAAVRGLRDYDAGALAEADRLRTQLGAVRAGLTAQVAAACPTPDADGCAAAQRALDAFDAQWRPVLGGP